MDWVRLISPNIEQNRTSNFVWEIEPNRTQSIGLCSIGFGHRTQSNTIQLIKFDRVRLPNFFCVSSISFDCGNQSNSIHGLGSIEFDWNSVRLGSIDYAGSLADIFPYVNWVLCQSSFSVPYNVRTLVLSSQRFSVRLHAHIRLTLDMITETEKRGVNNIVPANLPWKVFVRRSLICIQVRIFNRWKEWSTFQFFTLEITEGQVY